MSVHLRTPIYSSVLRVRSGGWCGSSPYKIYTTIGTSLIGCQANQHTTTIGGLKVCRAAKISGYTYVCICVCTCVCIHACMCMCVLYVCMHIYVYVCHTCMHPCVRAYVYVPVRQQTTIISTHAYMPLIVHSLV